MPLLSIPVILQAIGVGMGFVALFATQNTKRDQTSPWEYIGLAGIGMTWATRLLLDWRARHLDKQAIKQPPTVRERLDALAAAMDRASEDLRGLAKQVEKETTRINADLDKQIGNAVIEVQARQAMLEQLIAQSRQYEQIASMHKEQAKEVADLFRAQAEEVAKTTERKSRRREWGLATLGGFSIGIASILASHFFFGL